MPAADRLTDQVKPLMEVSSREFADKKSKIAWEIGKQVSELAPQLPVETSAMSAKTIRFDSAHQTRGTYAVLFTGTVVGTAQKGVFVVPERTLLALRKLGIPYREV